MSRVGKDWLRRDREAARMLGLKGGKVSGARHKKYRSLDYDAGYSNGYHSGVRHGRAKAVREFKEKLIAIQLRRAMAKAS